MEHGNSSADEEGSIRVEVSKLGEAGGSIRTVVAPQSSIEKTMSGNGDSSADEDGSIRVKVPRLVETGGSVRTVFVPQRSIIETTNSGNRNSSSPTRPPPVPAPEKKLTLFALRLGVLEKAATKIGALAFVWATVVLLGGFAITLDRTDFWFITVILVIEGARIFSRSHELELQHQSTWTIADAGISSFHALITSSRFLVKQVKAIFRPSVKDRKQNQRIQETNEQKKRLGLPEPTRSWKSSDVPILPYAGWIFLSRNVSKLFYWLQVLSASACVALSLFKLIKRNYGDIDTKEKRNLPSALTIFYSLALAEALLFLIERAYWEWKVSGHKVLKKVKEECGLEESDMISITRFFYDAYSKCLNGSIFDGLKMDMVTFAMELLDSSSPDEQLMGARILCKFTKNEDFSNDTLQKIGINLEVIERLVEMLNWKNPQQEEIRQSAANILVGLASKKQNSLRVAGISGAMESISSLLQNTRSFDGSIGEIGEKKITHDDNNYDHWKFSNLGLLILKRLARDQDNCWKIGNTRGLLAKIIDFTHAEERLLKDENATHSQIMAVKRSLTLVRMLASTTGATGKQLRTDISEIVFTISNIRVILRHGQKHPTLQKLGIEILTFLALEDDATEKIGGTGGILEELLGIFLEKEISEDQNHVKIAAGEALALLALGSGNNCHRILRLRVLEGLVNALTVPLLRVNAARILRNLCKYTAAEFSYRLKDIKAAAATVLQEIVSEDSKLQEVMLGLAVQVFKLMSPEESSAVLLGTGTNESALAKVLVEILNKYSQPTIRVPRIRRFAIELAIWMMEADQENVKTFKHVGMDKELERVLETTAELENFDVFSGTVGVRVGENRHVKTINLLVETALNLLEGK